MTQSKKIDGVLDVKMDQNTATLRLRFDPNITSRPRITAAVEKILAAIH